MDWGGPGAGNASTVRVEMLTEELKKNSTCSAYEQLKYEKEKLRDIHPHYMDSAEAVIKRDILGL